MCVFCAAVPMAASLGAAATAKQKQAKRKSSEQALSNKQTLSKNSARWSQIPAEKVTLILIAGLIAGSAVYHSRISSI